MKPTWTERRKRRIESKVKKGIYSSQDSELFREHLTKIQRGRCAICGRLPHEVGRGGILKVDHDHKTGKVRGLLCNACNIGLGAFQDSIEVLAKAIEYLGAFSQ